MIWRMSRSGADPFCSTESICLMVLLSSHTIEYRGLTMPLHDRNRRTAPDGAAGRHIAGYPALAADPGTITNGKRPGDSGLTADGDEIAQAGRAGNAALRHHDAAAPQHHVVGDLHQIINHRAG